MVSEIKILDVGPAIEPPFCTRDHDTVLSMGKLLLSIIASIHVAAVGGRPHEIWYLLPGAD